VLDGGQYWTNSFIAARGDKTAMQPFAKLLWTLCYSSSFYKVVFVMTDYSAGVIILSSFCQSW